MTTTPTTIAQLAAARLDFARPLPPVSDPVKVADFINERPRFVAELEATATGTPAYERLAGHAEARRQLATTLGWTVPHHPGDTTAPCLTHVRLVQGGDLR